MANLPEPDDFPTGIYQLEDTDPVKGGAPNEATGDGMDNIPHAQLARRTRWLKTRVDQLLTSVSNLTSAIASLVPNSRTISAAGLATGGGQLNANRTITVTDASQSEAEAGTATNRAMSPLRVSQAIKAAFKSERHMTSGWQTLPSGLIIHWGRVVTSGSDGIANVVLPQAFPNDIFVVQATDSTNDLVPIQVHQISVGNFSRFGFSILAINASGAPSSTGVQYIAIGY